MPHDEHRVTVMAPAEIVFDLISDVRRWPYTLTPTIHAEQLERTGGTERIRLWALANGEVKTWTSLREIDATGKRVSFRQEVTQAPAAEMRGEWILEPNGPRETSVLLTHDYRAIDDDPEREQWIRLAVDRNSVAELDRIKVAAERRKLDELTLSFEDSLRIGGSAGDVYEFLYQAKAWPERLPHVARLELEEDVPGVQRMEMDTRGADGSVHTTKSIRICFDGERIVYKQTEVPALMSAHTGEWQLEPDGDGVLATSRHTVVIEPAAVPKVFGEGATLRKAREFVQQALSKNSCTTLAHAKAFAEARRG
ncbi:aromatase/cyclase [Amycolatopsis sp. cg5]|uniref:aromatase/cyclase n=1 Tax=Amycolatopsis sp. cg5 TaxID=3238802 RepID=UPI0035260258